MWAVDRGRWTGTGVEPERHGLVLVEQPHLQLPQLHRWLDTELLHERGPELLERPQGVGLTSIAVERDHQLRPEPLPERMLADQRLQLADQRAVTPDGEIRLDPVPEHRQPQLAETAPLDIGLLYTSPSPRD